MAYIDQEQKRRINGLLKPVLKKYGAKASLRIRHHSTLVCTVRGGNFNPVWDYTGQTDPAQFGLTVTPYHYKNHFSGATRDFLREFMGALMDWNHDNSDIMTDYFDVGWYVDIRFEDVQNRARFTAPAFI